MKSSNGIGRRSWLGMVFLLLILGAGCDLFPAGQNIRKTLFIGVDASGSFKRSGHYDNALKFLAHYIYGHLNGVGGLGKSQALFVGSVGGKRPNEPKTFHPIHDFKGKNIEQIEENLRTWFTQDDPLTDFNSFFEEVARITKERNLILAPITMMVVSDGIPDFAKTSAAKGPKKSLYTQINLKPLEYLSRNITLRLTYVSPTVGKHWRTQVARKRVQLWTVSAGVMKQWPDYIQEGVDVACQDRFWEWLRDNVDFKVRAGKG